MKNIRIGAIDFGLKRIGLAYTDELHISINPYDTIINDSKKWDNIKRFFEIQRIGALVIGMPYSNDGTELEIHKEIRKFAQELSEKFNFDVHFQDEYSSSIRASEYLVKSGAKKSKRSKKGQKDKIAACFILEDFINETKF